MVGGGHNGLTAAAYLARAGQSVLVLERRERLGGACTLEQPFDDERFLVSPCAYVVGLLDQLVIDELDLPAHGYSVTPVDPTFGVLPRRDLFRPVPQRRGHRRAHARERILGSGHRGALAYEVTFDRIRRLLRAGAAGDLSVRPITKPRAHSEEMLGDVALISIVFEEPIAETLTRYVSDARLVHALFGQGVIGEWAGPKDRAGVYPPDARDGGGRGHGGSWGYVEAAWEASPSRSPKPPSEAGATLAAGVPVARIIPGEGVELESGELIRARCVLSNADPKRVLEMLSAEALPTDYRERLEAWEVRSPVVKVNAALRKLPSFTAPGSVEPHRAMVTRHSSASTPPMRPSKPPSAASRRSPGPSSISRPPTTRAWRRRALT